MASRSRFLSGTRALFLHNWQDIVQFYQLHCARDAHYPQGLRPGQCLGGFLTRPAARTQCPEPYIENREQDDR